MRAFAFSLFLFLYWTIVGRAFLALCRDRLGALRAWLVAPTVGLAITVLGLMAGNQAGIPIGQFAGPMTWALLAAGAAILVWRRPVLPWRQALPCFAAAVFFIIWAGRPMFTLGFHWTSFVNDDYLNYCLAAERFRDFGFYRVPKLEELLGRDYTQYFWFMHVIGLMRFGAEHLVAWAASLAGLRALLAFMPTILALGAVQILAASGLVLHRGRWRRAAQMVAVALAISPMFIFGAIYQLIAQVGGLALTFTFVGLGTRALGSAGGREVMRAALPAAVVGAAMALFYPEFSPFGWLAIAFFLAGETLRRRSVSWGRVQYWLWIVVFACVLLRHNLLSYFFTLYLQATKGLSHTAVTTAVFPFFLIPSGLPTLFGLQGISGFPSEPWGSLLILAGAALLLLTLVNGARLAWRGEPVACLLLVQLALAWSLFRKGNDFGLYKSAMYVQPTALAALAWWYTRRSGLVRRGVALAYLGFALAIGWHYVRGSAEAEGPVTNELAGASKRITHMPPLNPSGGTWGVALDNVAAAKIAAERYRGNRLRFLDRDYFGGMEAFVLDYNSPFMWLNPHRDLYRSGRQLMEAVRQQVERPAELFGARFMNFSLPGDPAGYLYAPGWMGLFNKALSLPPDAGTLVGQMPANRAHNFTFFVGSDQGLLYYLPGPENLGRISLFQREYDGFQPQGGIYALGRFLLLRIQNPTAEVYLRVLASKSSKGPGRTHWTGKGVVLGRETVPLTFVGDGSGNVFAGPLHPVPLDGAHYIAVDFRETPSVVNIPRSGLNRLYFKNVPLDYRQLVAFGRDISVLSPEEYAALEAPSALTSKKQLLTDVGLAYCGFYEDGWVSESAHVELAGAQPAQALRVQGYAPDIDGRVQHLRVGVNGQTLPPLDYPPGPIDWLIPVPVGYRHTRFEITSDNPAVLPGRDGRPVSIWLTSLGLAPVPTHFDFVNAGGPRPFEPGVDTDGWASGQAELVLPARGAGHLRLELQFPNWGQKPKRGEVSVSVDGAVPQSRALPAGRTSINLAIPPGNGWHTVRLASQAKLTLPPPDGRVRAYQLLSADFGP